MKSYRLREFLQARYKLGLRRIDLGVLRLTATTQAFAADNLPDLVIDGNFNDPSDTSDEESGDDSDLESQSSDESDWHWDDDYDHEGINDFLEGGEDWNNFGI